jgi:CMP-N,N'-diacetyllegionaminic acid synthase
MANLKHVLAVVPARGGSKGIPRKNLCKIEGKSLVEHALHIGMAAASVSHVVLSTEDAEIAAIGEHVGVDVIPRPAELAADESLTLDVLKHVLDYLRRQNMQFDGLVLLEPTSPFRTPEIVDRCVELLLDGDCSTAVTVTQLERNPRYIFEVDGDDARFFVERPLLSFKRRQDFSRLKRINGCVYALLPVNIANNQLVADPIKVVEMDPEASINIDTPIDLAFAELSAKILIRRGLWKCEWGSSQRQRRN